MKRKTLKKYGRRRKRTYKRGGIGFSSLFKSNRKKPKSNYEIQRNAIRESSWQVKYIDEVRGYDRERLEKEKSDLEFEKEPLGDQIERLKKMNSENLQRAAMSGVDTLYPGGRYAADIDERVRELETINTKLTIIDNALYQLDYLEKD